MIRRRRIRNSYHAKRLQRQIHKDIAKNVERALNGQKPIKYDYRIKFDR